MSNPIIDPSVFYWMNVLSIIQTVLAVVGTFALIGSVSLAVVYLWKRSGLTIPDEADKNSRYDADWYRRQMKEYEEDLKYLALTRKWMIITTVIGSVFVILSIFIPSKQTSVEMLVARTATFDNVNWTVAQVKEIIDYIVSALKGAV